MSFGILYLTNYCLDYINQQSKVTDGNSSADFNRVLSAKKTEKTTQ